MITETHFLHSEDDTRALAASLVQRFAPQPVFALHGDLGAGKTRFAQGAAAALGVQDLVSSPTFAIALEHTTASGGRFIHMDLYRLGDEREAEDLGFEELIDSAECAVIEWPDVASALLPQRTIHISLQILPDGSRQATLHAPSP